MKIKPLDELLSLAVQIVKRFSNSPVPITEFDPQKVRCIIAVSSTAIGDTLLSTPAIRALRQRYPNARLVGHIRSKYIELFANNPHLDEIIPYYGGYHKFIRTVSALRRQNPDAIAILHGNGPQAIPMAFFSGAAFVVRIPNKSEYRFLLSNREEIPANECDPQEHGIQDRLRTAALLDAPSDNKRMVLVVDDESKQALNNYLRSKNFNDTPLLVGFQAAASTASRMWMKERFAKLGKQLLAQYPDLKIIITGSPQERSYCQEAAALIDNPRVLVSAGQIPLRHIPALIEKLDLLITGDTGVMHIAIAVGTPTVSLFAVADPRKSAACYDRDKHLVIYKGKTCDPCLSKKCPYAKCMEQIEVDEVFEAVQLTLNKGGKL